MSHKTALPRDDVKIVDTMIDALIEAHPRKDKRDFQRMLVDDLHAAAIAGDQWAESVLLALAVDGSGNRVHARLKADRGVVRIAQTGAVISLPTRFGVRAKSVDGARERHFQQPLWWELTWDRFEELIESLARQRNVLSGEITGLREILRLREQFPASATVGEACEMAGIDPRQFGIEAA